MIGVSTRCARAIPNRTVPFGPTRQGDKGGFVMHSIENRGVNVTSVPFAMPVNCVAETTTGNTCAGHSSPQPLHHSKGQECNPKLHPQTTNMSTNLAGVPVLSSPVSDVKKMFPLPTPIKLDSLLNHITSYANTNDTEILVQGFTHGFRLSYSGPRGPLDCRNLQSFYDHRDIHIRLQKLNSEIAAGRVKGPYTSQPPGLINLRCSPLGLVEKKEANTYRLIHHLSASARSRLEYIFNGGFRTSSPVGFLGEINSNSSLAAFR